MNKPFRLRPYQKNAVSNVVSRFRKENERRMLLYLPTGAGKTVIATHIIKTMLGYAGFGKVLFVAHRREILDQTARTIAQHIPDISIHIEQGERQGNGDAAVTIASVQSMVRRKERYDPKEYSLIICDECHRALAPSWEEVIDYFHSHTSQETLLLGMTATPHRTDGRSAQNVFGDIAFEISRTDLEDLGFLVPMQYFTVRSNLNLGKVKMSGGDFQVNALSTVMDMPKTRALTLKAWQEKGADKKTIVFCAGVNHAHHVAQDFAALGVAVEKIDGKTKDRAEILERFANREIQVLTNYGVLTEGFDDPTVDCILMARPTTSPLVYTQCVGRGLRTAQGKTACTVIDIVDRSTHQLQYGATQMAGLPSKWRTRGADPFRQAKSLEGIKVTSREGFLAIKNADSMEEVQSILMSLPPETVLAGLDGQPLLRYAPVEGPCSDTAARIQARALIDQAGVPIQKLTVTDDTVVARFESKEVDLEEYSHLKWHLSQVTNRQVVFEKPGRTNPHISPRALIKSILPGPIRIQSLSVNAEKQMVTATIPGLTPEEIQDVTTEFLSEYGMKLNLKGQLSLF